MEEVLYVCLWYKDKKRTWSGTAWSLRQAMEHYVTIRDFAISDPLYRKVLRKIQKKGLVPAPPLWDRLRMRACLGKREKIKTFQFGEFPTGDRYRSYIYQDLAVAAILWLMEHDPVSYRYCEYDGVAVEELKRRAASQLAAYRKSEAVFTMSRWLRDFLTEECGLPGEKVYAVGGGINVDAAGIRPGKKEGRRILFVGRNFLRKGGLLVVRAYGILKKKYLPEAELYLAGASAEGIRTALRDVGIPAEEKDLCGIHLLGDLTAEELATKAEFFSFGTNDLTQMTFGFSRDDAGKFLPAYYKRKIYEFDPFTKLDVKGVGKLIEMAAKLGRSVRPDIKLGICGEQGGDPASVNFCHQIGLSYISCSPFRVPIARLAAAQAAIQDMN